MVSVADPWGNTSQLQLLVPRQLHPKLLQLVPESINPSSTGLGVSKMRSFMCISVTSAQKGMHMQQYQVGAPMEGLALDVFWPLPYHGTRKLLHTCSYGLNHQYPGAYSVPDQSSSTIASAGWIRCCAEEMHGNQGGTLKPRCSLRSIDGWVSRRSGLHYSTHYPDQPPAARLGLAPALNIEDHPGFEYLFHLWEQLSEVHKLTRQMQVLWFSSHSRGKDFTSEALLCVYSPERKKGLFPLLMNHWIGPCTVFKVLSGVVYRVQLAKRRQVLVLHGD